jgi:ABC-2 type transport system ATP-binding protein
MTSTISRPRPAPGGAAETGPTLAVRTRGLTKTYGERTVVDDVDLTLPAGVVSGFIGPNGAGKTTTIRMLLGLVRPTRGRGEVLGGSLHDPAGYLGRVGALIEGPAFTPALSGRDNLLVLARAGGLPKSRVDEVLERVGLAERGGSQVRAYSLGMKQRLGIAAALLPEPQLLVLDEPTNGLDPAGIAQMRDLIGSFTHDGITVFVSSHLLGELEQVAEHLVMIQNGKLAFQGSVEALRRAHGPTILLSSSRPGNDDLLSDIAATLDLPGRVLGDGGVEIELPADVTDDGATALAAELNRRSHAVDVVLARLDVKRPSLEDAFFRLSGTKSGDVR